MVRRCGRADASSSDDGLGKSMNVRMSETGKFDLIIEPGKRNLPYWRDLWEYRELFGFLAWRDFLVRYKQTAIGVAWSVIRPVLTMIVFTIVFGKVAKLPSGDVPYPIMVFVAMLPWQFFATSFSEAANSLISNQNLLTKIYFPRIIVPASSVLVNVIDFLISFVILLVLMAFYRCTPNLSTLAFPGFLGIAFVSAMGLGLWTAALNVKYRDFRYIVPFIVQFGLYISPVGFSSSVVPDKWRLLYALNPLVGVIDGFRWAILGEQLHVHGFLISLGVALLLFWNGVRFFRKFERGFADIIYHQNSWQLSLL